MKQAGYVNCVILSILICSCSGSLPVKPFPKIDDSKMECVKIKKITRKNDLTNILRSYPEEAIKNAQEGWVLLSYDIINEKIENIKVFDSSPKGVFEKNALSTLKNSKVVRGTEDLHGCLFRSNYSLVEGNK